MIKKILTVLSISLIFNSFAPPIFAQEYSGCFLLGVYGRLFDLDRLCDGQSQQISIDEEPAIEEALYNPDNSREKESQPVSSFDIACNRFSTQHQAQEYFLRN